MKWFEGDRNTKFFHSHVKGRRKKLNISEIQSEQGDIISLGENLGAKAEDNVVNDFSMLDSIPTLISGDRNE